MTVRSTIRNNHRLIGLTLATVALLGLGVVAGLSLRARRLAAVGLAGTREPVADFRLLDPQSGRAIAMSDFSGRPAVVLIFLGIDCPIAELYLPRLAALHRAWAPRGVVFLGINANAHDTDREVAAHAQRNGIPFQVLRDVGNRVADQLQVDRMCEVLVLDGDRWVRYRGAIDDQYQIRARKRSPTVHYLAEALAAVMAGKPPPMASAPAFGCPIEREVSSQARASVPRISPAPRVIRDERQREAAGVEVGAVTFAEHVAPLIQEKCQSCHRPGQVGPFSLLTYAQVRRRATAIREAVEDCRMPPWHADPHFGRFDNDRSLTPPQRATLLAWLDQGLPEGDPAKLPSPRTFPSGWSIGTPDVVFRMPEPFAVQAEGAITYQHFRVPTQFTADRWVQAVEAQPGNRAVVHHIIVYIDDHDPAKQGRYSMMDKLAIYVPGDFPSIFPPGAGKRIPAGSDLILELHYTPLGSVRMDQSSVGLIFARSPIHNEVHTKGINNQKLVIPPGAGHFPVTSTYTLPHDARLLSLMPHTHLRGKDFLFEATYPDGTRETLLSVPGYDFTWQSVYRLAEPKRLPRGTRIDCLAHYDNSASNPSNPDPTQTVRWGEQITDEMIVGYIDFYFDPPRTAARDASAVE
jgi:peroxiredoxin